ncbi:MAG: hypothetical protein IPK04_18875 [Bdellovibrionales bacterium]|nr:hypothetical protein [Bdellovibrionales bacterium]
MEPILKMAEYLAQQNHSTWIRCVLIPGLTDEIKELKELVQFLRRMKNTEKIQPPSAELIQKTLGVFQQSGRSAKHSSR